MIEGREPSDLEQIANSLQRPEALNRVVESVQEVLTDQKLKPFPERQHTFKVSKVQALSSQGNSRLVLVADFHQTLHNAENWPDWMFVGDYEIVVRPINMKLVDIFEPELKVVKLKNTGQRAIARQWDDSVDFANYFFGEDYGSDWEYLTKESPTIRFGGGQIASEGDWIVRFQDEYSFAGPAFVVGNAEFEADFEPF